MAGEYDYLIQVQVADKKRHDDFYRRLINRVPGLVEVTSSFAMEQIKYTMALPLTELFPPYPSAFIFALANQEFIACDYLLS